MPQLDIILWFSQTFWFLLFCIFFISFVFVLYIPISCYAEGLPFYKKKDHYYRYNDLFFSYSRNIQDFFFYHKSR